MTNYTNAPSLISPDYRGPEDLEGLFSGWDAQARKYDTKTWAYQSEAAAQTDRPGQSQQSQTQGQPTTTPPPAQGGQPTGAGTTQPGGQPTQGQTPGGQPSGQPPQPQPGTPSTQPNQPGDDAQSFSARVGKLVGPPPLQDRTLQDPNTVFQIMKRHYARYTPEMIEQVCGTPLATIIEVAETLLVNSGPDKTSAICYAVGWTQHTTGVQLIRTATLVQLLLGNIGRPGRGILALRYTIVMAGQAVTVAGR